MEVQIAPVPWHEELTPQRMAKNLSISPSVLYWAQFVTGVDALMTAGAGDGDGEGDGEGAGDGSGPPAGGGDPGVGFTAAPPVPPAD
jgi:hypothetical protein